jgi:alkylation response protein AidB-like acyl-CoA dehydrogenase
MQSPGVSVRPTRLASGEHEVNEIWFENVKVPVANLVGEENRGWTYAKYLLTHERTNLAAIGQTKALLAHLKFVATEANNSDLSLMKDPLFRARVSQVEIELMALEMTTLRVLAEVHAGGAPGAESSMLKIKGTEIRQEIADLARRALGPYAVPFIAEALHGQHDSPLPGPDYANPLAARYFNFRKMSIYGGSNEIQKNIIAKQVLGL